MLKNNIDNGPTRSVSDLSEKKKRPSMMGRVAKTIKNSPKFVRKAFGNVKKAIEVGKSSDHSTLKNCQPNGWLYKDEALKQGVNYKVKYLGSVEVEYDHANTQNNQDAAQKAMRALYAHNKNQGAKNRHMALGICVDRIQLVDIQGSKVLMRHSTTRIAYSTVDTQRPKIFAYVAVVKNTQLALCHVFSCKNAKQGYEMTFVCAQAFDMNFRRWREDSEKARRIACRTEKTDIEPSQAWQKKKDDKSDSGSDSNSSVGNDSQPVTTTVTPNTAPNVNKPLPDGAPEPKRQSWTTGTATSTKKAKNGGMKIFLAIQEGQDPADLAENYFNSLGISMVEDEDDFEMFTDRVLRSESDVGQLQLGVDPEAYNATSDASGGYMTVGNFDFVDNEEEEDDDDEL